MYAREVDLHPSTEASADAVSRARGSRSLRVSLVVLGAFMLLWIWLFYAEGAFDGGPNGKAFGGDFAAYQVAAQVMAANQNPFDHHLLYDAESSYLRRQGLPITTVRAVVRVGQPPLFFWALEPLTHLPFQTVALAWILAVYVLSAFGFVAAARFVGLKWPVVPLILFLLMPQIVMAAFYGNVVGIVFAAVGCSLLLLRRYPFVAGAILTLAWLKPQVGFPIVLLLALFLVASRRQLIYGFGVASICMGVLTALLVGPHALVWWMHGLTDFSADMTLQPSLACLSGLYVRWAHASLRLMLEELALGAACWLTATTWLRHHRAKPAGMADIGWLWCVWLLATPYAHFPDEILLAPAIMAMFVRTRETRSQFLALAAVYLLFLSLFLTNWYPLQANLLSLPLLAVALCLRFALPHLTPSRPVARERPA